MNYPGYEVGEDAPDSLIEAATHLPNNCNTNFDLFHQLCKVEDGYSLAIDIIVDAPYGHMAVQAGPTAN